MKGTGAVTRRDLTGLRRIADETALRRRIVVCTESAARIVDGIEIQEPIDRLATFQVVEQRLGRHACPAEDRRAAGDSGIAVHDRRPIDVVPLPRHGEMTPGKHLAIVSCVPARAQAVAQPVGRNSRRSTGSGLICPDSRRSAAAGSMTGSLPSTSRMQPSSRCRSRDATSACLGLPARLHSS